MRHATMPKTVEALLEGRARVAKGWCQGELDVYRPDCLGGTAYCAVGAMVLFGEGACADVYLSAALPAGAKDVAAYNDHPSRTQADILALYDRAIDLALAEAWA